MVTAMPLTTTSYTVMGKNHTFRTSFSTAVYYRHAGYALFSMFDIFRAVSTLQGQLVLTRLFPTGFKTLHYNYAWVVVTEDSMNITKL